MNPWCYNGQADAGQQPTAEAHPSISDLSWPASSWWQINYDLNNPWCGLGTPAISIYPTMPAYAAITTPIVVAIGQSPVSVMLAPYTWLPQRNSSCPYYLNAQPCLSCSLGYPELDSRLTRHVPPTMNNDSNLLFHQNNTSWSDLSTCDLWNRFDDDASKVAEHQGPAHDDDHMSWQIYCNRSVGEQREQNA